jgi:hypothetical protein
VADKGDKWLIASKKPETSIAIVVPKMHLQWGSGNGVDLLAFNKSGSSKAIMTSSIKVSSKFGEARIPTPEVLAQEHARGQIAAAATATLMAGVQTAHSNSGYKYYTPSLSTLQRENNYNFDRNFEQLGGGKSFIIRPGYLTIINVKRGGTEYCWFYARKIPKIAEGKLSVEVRFGNELHVFEFNEIKQK